MFSQDYGLTKYASSAVGLAAGAAILKMGFPRVNFQHLNSCQEKENTLRTAQDQFSSNPSKKFDLKIYYYKFGQFFLLWTVHKTATASTHQVVSIGGFSINNLSTFYVIFSR